MLNIFIGYDPREHDAYDVCRSSLIRHSSEPVLITPLRQGGLRASGLYWRASHTNGEGQRIDDVDGTPFSTEFSFSRFLVPELARRNNIHGPVMFVDCDFLFTGDISRLFDSFETQEDKAVGVVKHNYVPVARRKMDNCEQVPYNRKLWSALMLFNPWHPACLKLTPEVVTTSKGSYLHPLQWVDDANIGDLSEEWHWIPDVSPTTGIARPALPAGIHYTEGGPWFDHYKNVEFAQEWTQELALHKAHNTFNWNNLVTV